MNRIPMREHPKRKPLKDLPKKPPSATMKQLKSMIESYNLCVADDSPLSEMSKGVVRGFFKGTIVNS